MVGLPCFFDAGCRVSQSAAAMDDDRFARNVATYLLVDDKAVRTAADVRRHTEVMIEADLQRPWLERLAPIRHALGRHAEMPLAKRRGAVALTLA